MGVIGRICSCDKMLNVLWTLTVFGKTFFENKIIYRYWRRGNEAQEQEFN